MKKLNWKNSVVGAGLLISFIFVFFPTSSFISAQEDNVYGVLKQQHINTIGEFIVSPLRAAGFFYYNPDKTLWIDVRPAEKYEEEHLEAAVNMAPSKIIKEKWPVDNILLIFDSGDGSAETLVAKLRHDKNVRAFLVKGGFPAVKKCLMDPVSLELKASLSKEKLEELIKYRNELSGSTQEEIRFDEEEAGEEEIEEGC